MIKACEGISREASNSLEASAQFLLEQARLDQVVQRQWRPRSENGSASDKNGSAGDKNRWVKIKSLGFSYWQSLSALCLSTSRGRHRSRGSPHPARALTARQKSAETANARSCAFDARLNER